MKSFCRMIVPFLFVLFSGMFDAMADEYFFYVQLTDKNDSPYSLSAPSEFLSQRAIERRSYFRLNCDSTDLPVNPTYINQIKSAGFAVHNKSNWLNGVTVVTADSAAIASVEGLSFVESVEYTGKRGLSQKGQGRRNISLNNTLSDVDYYGSAGGQIDQINGRYLHNSGYRGEGIHIAVIDAGFENVDINSAFNPLFLENRLLGTKDFVFTGSDVYRENSHGAGVLSIMAANIPNLYVGTAPDASYWLFRTEYVSTEYPVEMDFWVSAIEYADSVGIDVVNSSLGYSVFTDSRLNLTYADLDGNATRITRAATLAADKGIIVVSSAGNEGNKDWKYINVPADAKNIITVGSVDAAGTLSAFSSRGPTADERLKPELVAQGTSTSMINKDGVFQSNGTSFSSPVIAGTMACLLQAARGKHTYIPLQDLFDIVFKTGTHYEAPDANLGYGIPDFEKATRVLLSSTNNDWFACENINIYTDSMAKSLRIVLDAKLVSSRAIIQIVSMNGMIVYNQPVTASEILLDTGLYPAGIYALQIISADEKNYTYKFLIK